MKPGEIQGTIQKPQSHDWPGYFNRPLSSFSFSFSRSGENENDPDLDSLVAGEPRCEICGLELSLLASWLPA
jgi:hypothetical protein